VNLIKTRKILIFEIARNWSPAANKLAGSATPHIPYRTGRAWWDCLARNRKPSAELSDGLTLTRLKQSDRQQETAACWRDEYRQWGNIVKFLAKIIFFSQQTIWVTLVENFFRGV
jgi:hypothetical protein